MCKLAGRYKTGVELHRNAGYLGAGIVGGIFWHAGCGARPMSWASVLLFSIIFSVLLVAARKFLSAPAMIAAT